jgi:hypothetical protein
MPVISCLSVPCRAYLCLTVPCLSVPIRSYSCLPVPCHAYTCLPCLVMSRLPPYLSVPNRVVSCMSVPTHVVPCVFVPTRAVLTRVMSSRVVLGPLNRACRAVSKMKKPNHVMFKNTTRDTYRAGTDRHACCAVSLSCRFMSWCALTREYDFRSLMRCYEQLLFWTLFILSTLK